MKIELPLDEGSVELDLSRGFYFLTSNPESGRGLTISVRDPFFPEVKTADMMGQTIRYITSRTEFEAMTNSDQPRAGIEQFWIDCAGSKEKARELIKVYYNRVREANLYFSHVVPGWKSDRGLIHIVFGNPKKVFQYPNKEVWLYGEEDNVNSLQFTFRKVASPYGEEILALSRDQAYKTDWERAVTSWRNGRIYSE
ncbi:MAG: GWxTD domain-containing protein [Flavobacteriales bacterium]|nr:GWxTD domain-containing protein [Flavobacteriales bacterium]